MKTKDELVAEHKCQYCGAMTSQPGEVCWNAPGPLNKGKDDTWDDILSRYESSEYRDIPLINYLRSNYNVPTLI